MLAGFPGSEGLGFDRAPAAIPPAAGAPFVRSGGPDSKTRRGPEGNRAASGVGLEGGPEVSPVSRSARCRGGGRRGAGGRPLAGTPGPVATTAAAEAAGIAGAAGEPAVDNGRIERAVGPEGAFRGDVRADLDVGQRRGRHALDLVLRGGVHVGRGGGAVAPGDGDGVAADGRDLAGDARQDHADRGDGVAAVACLAWLKVTWSPTARSPTVMAAPPFVIVVVLMTGIVRVQPSAVARAR